MKYEIEIKQACEGFWSCISPDAWIQSIGGLIGAALGAFLGGLGAYLIFISEKKRNEQEINSLFRRKYYPKREWLELVIEQIGLFIENYDDNSLNLPKIKIIKGIIDKARELLLTIQEEAIPESVYRNYFNICEVLARASSFLTLYELQYGEKLPMDVDKNSLVEILEEIKVNKQELESANIK
ncbi:hypothetical protein [Peribacillus frigoritolerans]|uniref:hypothetical protein n=1 Tax=Peribacillus frigoritolerans TaxID=450367 RepID=UPI00228258CE|nr:hypothetical protein [Peribacillus frigoritolerans]MCY9005642.1 hypothetical protein [Peribacillus frigoritolerans]